MKLFIRKLRTHANREPKWLWWCGHRSSLEGQMCTSGRVAFETWEEAYERVRCHALIRHQVNLPKH